MTNRLKEPAESTNGTGRPVVWLPGQATYVSHLYKLREVLNERCGGRTHDIPHEIKKTFRYFSLRAGIAEAYTVAGEGELAKLAIQKAREAAANGLLREEALKRATTADVSKEAAERAQAKAEDKARRLREENTRLRRERNDGRAAVAAHEKAAKAQAELLQEMARTAASLAGRQDRAASQEPTFPAACVRDIERWVTELKGGVHFILSGWVATLKIALRAACKHPGRWVEFVSKKSVTDVLAELKEPTLLGALDRGETVTIKKGGVLYTTTAACDRRKVGDILAAARRTLTPTQQEAWDAGWSEGERRSKRQVVGVFASFQIVEISEPRRLADGSEDPVYTMFGRPNQGRFKYACFLDMV